MEIHDETLIRLSGEQIILRSAIKWLLAREARRSGDIDAALRNASEFMTEQISAFDDRTRGFLQENIDQLVAAARLEAQR
jgi:hypothetical protein